MHHYRLPQLSILLISINCITPTPVQLPADHKLRELNYAINENTLHWITARSFENKSEAGFRNAISSNGSSVRYWYRTEDVAYNSHTGTHLDAPCHFSEKAWCVDEIPIEHLMDIELYVLDVTAKIGHNPDYQVTVDDLQTLENTRWIQNGSLLFIKTGWSSRWPIKDNYFGVDPGGATMHFPGISPELADYIANKGIFVGVGIEGPSIDPGLSTDKYAHRTLFASNMYAIENLPNLKELTKDGEEARVTIAPLKVEGASGSPVRIFVRSKLKNSAAAAGRSPHTPALFHVAILCLLLSITSTFHV